MQTVMTGRSIGSVTWINVRQGVAASILAASNCSGGSPCSAANRMIVNHGAHIQISVRMTSVKLGQRSDSQATSGNPRYARNVVITPNWSLNDQRIMVAVMTGAMVSGKRMTVRTSGLPKKGLL